MRKNPNIPQKAIMPQVLTCLAAGTISLTLLIWMFFVCYPPTGWYQDQQFDTDLSWLLALFFKSLEQTISSNALPHLIFNFDQVVERVFFPFFEYDLLNEIGFRFATISIATLCAMTAAFLHCRRYLENEIRVTHLHGRQLFKGKQAIRETRRAFQHDIKRSGSGINLAPRVTGSKDMETKHSLIIGASGAGKTQIFRYQISQILKRGDRAILHDTKGDVTATLPSDDYILLSPLDKRGWIWDIAKDCRSPEDAQEFAKKLIPTMKDRYWSDGAQNLLTGIIIWLQEDLKTDWDWADLEDRIFGDLNQLDLAVSKLNPLASKYIAFEPGTSDLNRTSFSFFVTFWTYTSQIISPLAKACRQKPSSKRLSLSKWIKNTGEMKQVLILQRNPQYEALSKAWIGAAVQMMAGYAASSLLPESRSQRIWLFLDEFPQLGKLEGFQQFLEVGRSKGICCVLGAQDIEQLAAIYSVEIMKSWLNSTETKIICKMNAGPSANFISKDIIGQREVSWTEESKTSPEFNFGISKSGSHNVSRGIKTATLTVLTPNELEKYLGPKTIEGETKIRALLLANGDAYQLDWPLTIWPNRRPATEPADWLKS